jgi:hypothetical protein
MEPSEVHTTQPLAANKRRGVGRPFVKNDPRINRGGVPSEIRAFHTWMRETFARALQEQSEEGLTNGEHIIRTLIQKAKDGDIKAIEYVFDRMGGKALQSVELSGTPLEQVLTPEVIEEQNRIIAQFRVAQDPVGQTLRNS